MTDIYSKGGQLQIGDGATPEIFTTVAQVTSLGLNMALETVESTAHDTSGNWREFIAGLLDGGTVSFELNYDPVEATHKDAAGGILNSFKNRTNRNWKIIWPNTGATSFSFSGFVQSFNISDPATGAVLSATGDIKVNGAVTLA